MKKSDQLLQSLYEAKAHEHALAVENLEAMLKQSKGRVGELQRILAEQVEWHEHARDDKVAELLRQMEDVKKNCARDIENLVSFIKTLTEGEEINQANINEFEREFIHGGEVPPKIKAVK